MYERSHVSVKVEPRSTLYILPLFCLRDYNLRALTWLAKNESVEINLNRKIFLSVIFQKLLILTQF